MKRKINPKTRRKSKYRNPKLEEIPLTETETEDLINSLIYAIVYGHPFLLTNAIVLIKNGGLCTDCGEEFTECSCEKCENCLLQHCLCDLNVDADTIDSNKIRISSWKLANELFSKKELNKLKIQILRWLSDGNPPKISSQNREFIYKLLKDAD